MRAIGKAGLALFGFLLAAVATLSVAGVALGAAPAIGRSTGRPNPSRVHRQRRLPPPFIPSGVIAVGEDSDPQIIIVQPPAPAPVVSERTEPAPSKTYVPPRWVDGGYGVQILEPGHWVESKQPAKR